MHTKVDKTELIATLTANRERHVRLFEDADRVYRRVVLDRLRKLVEHIEAGGKIRLGVRLDAEGPESHAEDYDRAIQMCEMSLEQGIELDESDFETLVLDKWRWSERFSSSSASYSSSNSISTG